MRLAFAILLVACSGTSGTPTAAPKPSAPATAPAVTPARTDDNLEDVATRLGRAALSGDRATALALTLSYADVAKISKKAAEREAAEWDAEVKDFFDRIAKEGSDGKVQVTGAKVVKTDKLTPEKDSKVTREIELAVVQLVIAQEGHDPQPQGMPLLFFKTDAGWRFSPKQ